MTTSAQSASFLSRKPKLAPVWSIFVRLWQSARQFNKNCFTNLNTFPMSELDYSSSIDNNFSLHHWISVPNWAGWLIIESFFWEGHIFTAFSMTVHQKVLYWPIEVRPRPGEYLGKNQNCIKTRPYLANIRIS